MDEVLGYQGQLDTTWTLSLDRLQQDSPAAVTLLQLAAFLAPEPIPLRLFTGHPELLDEPLRTTAADPDALADTLGVVVGFSLARRELNGFQLHRLVQAVIRHRQAPAQQQTTTERVLTLLAAAHPGDPENAASWSSYAELAPHVLAITSLESDHPGSRQLILATTRYLQLRGDGRAYRRISEELLDRWRRSLGPDDPDTLTLASNLTITLVDIGEYEQARRLGQDMLDRWRRVLGPDHPTTLRSAAVLAYVLVERGSLSRLAAWARTHSTAADECTTPTIQPPCSRRPS
jgi:hypothetical protein